LEITQPRLYKLTASLTDGCENDTTSIKYDAYRNPPGTHVSLVQRFADGRVVQLSVEAERHGTTQIPLGRGRSTIELKAVRELNGNKYFAPALEVELHGMRTGDAWNFEFVAEKRLVDVVERWYVEMNLFSQFISNSLRVSAVTLTTLAGGDWTLRNPDIGADLVFTASEATVQLLSTPVFNRNWKFFSKVPATSFLPPTVSLRFTMTC
jgi:hypothetical protein